MIVKLCATPEQPLAEGVTVIVAVTGELVAFTAVKAGIAPVPFAARPIEGLLFVQLKPVPLTVPVKGTAPVVEPLHKTWLTGGATLGVGLTVIVKICEAPGQPLAVGVTVMVAVTGALVMLTAVNAGICPLPLAAKPIELLLFVQVKLVPLTAPAKFIASVVAALHNV